MKSDDASVCHIATGDNLHCLHAVLQLLRLTQALQTCIFYIYTLSQLYLLYILQTIYTNTHTHAQVGGRDLFTVHSLTTLIGTLLPLLIHAIIQINQSPHWGSFTGIWDYNGHLNLVGDDWENTTCFFFQSSTVKESCSLPIHLSPVYQGQVPKSFCTLRQPEVINSKELL